VKPAPFDYVAASSIEEAIDSLHQHGDAAKVLAGGQSLVPLMNLRLVRPSVLVDVNPIESLSFIEEDSGRLRIGALTRAHDIEQSSVAQHACPLLSEASRWIGHRAIRHRGTIGGSLAHNDPAAEYPLMAALLGARLVMRSAGGVRTLAAADFAVDYLTTALRPDELLTQIDLAVVPPGTGWSFREMARRHGDFALAEVGVTIVNRNGVIGDVKVAVGGAGPVARRLSTAEQALKGEAFRPDTVEAASHAAAAECQAESDLHASAEYRQHLVRTLVAEALREAWSRA